MFRKVRTDKTNKIKTIRLFLYCPQLISAE